VFFCQLANFGHGWPSPVGFGEFKIDVHRENVLSGSCEFCFSLLHEGRSTFDKICA
jgi:hypothetical protein